MKTEYINYASLIWWLQAPLMNKKFCVRFPALIKYVVGIFHQ